MAKKTEFKVLGTLVDKIDWTYDVYPTKIQAGEYYVGDVKYGIWKKKEAELIAKLLRSGFVLSVIHSAMQQVWQK